MSGQIDAFGNLATAALAAREFDRGPLHDPGAPGLCANCEAPVAGRYCANCGQPAHVHRSVLHVVEEFLHGLTHFDGKAWKTLPLLLFRPGKLTYDYVHGKRARYVPPVALFLLSVFMMFFAFSFVEGPPDMQLDKPVVVSGTPADRAKLRTDADSAFAELERELAAARVDPKRADDVAGLELAVRAGKSAQAAAHRVSDGKSLISTDDQAALSIEGAAKLLRDADKKGELNLDTGSAAVNERVRHALDNPELTIYKVQSKAYKFSFLLVPPLHMFAQLKGAYQLSVFGAGWRAVVLATAAVITLAFFAVLIALLGVVD
jgi:hypothetical protein